MRKFSGKIHREFKTRVLYSITFFQKIVPFCETVWQNTVDSDRPQMTKRNMRIACWITKATNAHSECVTFISFPREQMLRERALMSRYT